MPWEDVKAVFRPEGVHMGVMRSDPEKCTRPRGSACQLCWDNCPLRAWELAEGEEPHLVENHNCFSCYNCMVACPRNAISIVDPYHVDEGGFYATLPHALEAKPPAKPLDADGNADEWTTVEKAILNRRSVRNFKDKPVPEHLVRRVLEAGRFAPSAGNSQPWKFIVITNRALIEEINEGVWAGINMLHSMYVDDEMVKQLAAGYEMAPQPSLYDPRVIIAGMGSAAKRNGPILLAAPVVVLILEDERGISAGGINIGICGQNMNLAANSLGLGFCWVGFATVAGLIPPLAEKLGIKPPWKVMTGLVMGYPSFKQEGMVPREYRPVTWFREGTDGSVEE